MLRVQKVLVATDFSLCSEVARNYAVALARRLHACLHVLHVVEASSLEGFEVGGYVTTIGSVQRELEESESAQLDEWIADAGCRDLPVKADLVMLQAPAQAIVEYATRERIDLIVIGTHGRVGLAHLVMGSVAEKVVRTAPCPVLTVRTQERDFVSVASIADRAASVA